MTYTWTYQKPTKEGWYWRKDPDGRSIEVVHVQKYMDALAVWSKIRNYWMLVKTMNGQWSSEPIAEPKEAT